MTNQASINQAVTAITGLSPFDGFPAARRKLAEVMATQPHKWTPRRPDEPHKVGDVRWVNAFGRQRRGIVVKVARTRTTIAYVVPNSPDAIKTATEPHDRITVEPMR